MIKKLLAAIGGFFRGVFSAIERTWNSLSPEVRNAVIHSSALLDYINRNPEMPAEELADYLKEQFPEIGADKLGEVAARYGLYFTEGDYLSIVTALQKYLGALEGSVWAQISSAISKALAVLTAPEGTKFAVIDLVMTWAFHRFVKKPDVISPPKPPLAPPAITAPQEDEE